MQRSAAGDKSSLDTLLSRHYDRIYAICRRLAANEADAADSCQEALIAVVKGLDSYDGRASFRTWSYRVASNTCLDELRRRNRRPIPTPSEDKQGAPEPAVDASVADRLTLQSGLHKLQEEFRVAVVLRDIAGLNYAEISELTDVPPGTVRSRISRGRRDLRKFLGNQDTTAERLS